MGLVIVATAPELCQKCDFFLKKRMKEIFANAPEFMPTFNRMQNTKMFCAKLDGKISPYRKDDEITFIHSGENKTCQLSCTNDLG